MKGHMVTFRNDHRSHLQIWSTVDVPSLDSQEQVSGHFTVPRRSIVLWQMCRKRGVSVWYVLLRRLRTAHRVFQCDSDAIWTFDDRKVQKHNVSSVKDGSRDCAIRMRPLPGRLDLLSVANFAQRLPKNTILSGLRGRSRTWAFFQNKR